MVKDNDFTDGREFQFTNNINLLFHSFINQSVYLML